MVDEDDVVVASLGGTDLFSGRHPRPGPAFDAGVRKANGTGLSVSVNTVANEFVGAATSALCRHVGSTSRHVILSCPRKYTPLQWSKDSAGLFHPVTF